MSVVLPCCSQQPYLGMDSQCSQQALICLSHSSHCSSEGVLHNIIPLSHFKRTINELKFQMADKVAVLTDQYSAFMDELLTQIADLRARKVVELGTLWLRELADSEEEYQQLKRLFRNDIQGFRCSEIYAFHQKITRTQNLQRESLQKMQAYAHICDTLRRLSDTPKAGMLIMEKVTNLEGMLQNGQILKRALPIKRVLKDKTKQVLLEGSESNFDIRFNRAQLKSYDKNYFSVFSKYPLIKHAKYYLSLKTRFANLMVGVCKLSTKNMNSQVRDLHYNENSITYNCSNGCIYRDGIFQSGANCLTKGLKEVELVLSITEQEITWMLGKQLISRANLDSVGRQNFYLHVLMRTKEDSLDIEVDQNYIAPSKEDNNNSQIQPPSYEEIGLEQNNRTQGQVNTRFSQESYPTKGKLQNINQLYQSFEIQKPAKVRFIQEKLQMKESNIMKSVERNDKSNVIVNLESSIFEQYSREEDKRKMYF